MSKQARPEFQILAGLFIAAASAVTLDSWLSCIQGALIAYGTACFIRGLHRLSEDEDDDD